MSHSFTVKQSTVRPERRKDKVAIETQTSPNTQASGSQSNIHGFKVKQSAVRPERRQDKVEIETQTSPNPQASTSQPREQRREGYTVIRPDEKKHQKLVEEDDDNEEEDDEDNDDDDEDDDDEEDDDEDEDDNDNVHHGATKEEQKYNELKKSTPVKMTPSRVGGDCRTQQEINEQRQCVSERSARLKEFERRQKREEYKRKEKEKEEKEIQKKKEAAREQAEKNARKEEMRREEHRRHNLDYFGNKFSGCAMSSSLTVGTSSEHAATRNFPGHVTSSQAGVEDNLAQLCRLYPNYEPAILSEILMSSGGSIEHAKALLQ